MATSDRAETCNPPQAGTHARADNTPAANNPQPRLTIDQAFQRLELHFDEPRRQLQDAFRGGKAHLWGTNGQQSFCIPEDWFEGQVFIAVEKETDGGWHAKLSPHVAIDHFYETEWDVPAEEIEALINTHTSSPRTKRGAKGFDELIRELLKTQFYLDLYDDDVKAHQDISASRYAAKLTIWAQKHPHIGEKCTPVEDTIRKKIPEWQNFWNTLKATK